MIQLLLFGVGIAIILFAFGLFGNLPPTPDFLLQFNTYIEGILSGIVLFAKWLFTPEIFYGGMVIAFAIIFWEPLYHTSMYVLKKIPLLGIN